MSTPRRFDRKLHRLLRHVRDVARESDGIGRMRADFFRDFGSTGSPRS
jgi:hypothetical protein